MLPYDRNRAGGGGGGGGGGAEVFATFLLAQQLIAVSCELRAVAS